MELASPDSVHGDVAGRLLERDRELAAIEEALERVAGGSGAGLIVRGVAGVGKSALLAEGCARAEGRGLLVLTARGSELEQEMPFGIARQLFEAAVRRLPDSEQSIVLAGAAAHTRSLLGLADEPAAGGDPLGVIYGLYWLAANLSDRARLLLAIDDLHWADSQTVRWLSYLAARVADLAVLVLATARSDEPAGGGPLAELEQSGAVGSLGLEPLGIEAIAELVRAQFPHAVEQRFVEACHAATGGNPFFVLELLRSAAADGIEPTADQAALVQQLGPPEVARSIMVRLARLGEPARKIAHAVAILGPDGEVRHVARLSELSIDQTLKTWDLLTRAEILQSSQPLRFIHPIARAAVYQELAPGERSGGHRLAGSTLAADAADAQRIAIHALACEPAGDPEVVQWLRDGATKAAGAGAPDAAARYLERALREPPSVERRPQLQFELGQALMGLDNARAAESFGEAAKIDHEPSRVEAQRWQAYALGYAGRLREAMSTYERAIELVGADREAALRLTGDREFYGAWYGDAPDRTERRVRLGELASSLDGKTHGERQVLAAAAAAAMHDGAMPASQALRLARTIDRSGLSWPDRFDDVTRGCVAFVQIICDDDAAADLFEKAIAECVSQGRLIDLGFALTHLSIIRFRRGALLDAEVSARSGWEIVGVVGPAAGVVYAWSAAALLEVLIARGALDEATVLLEETKIGAQLPPIVIFPWPETLRGELTLAQGRIADGVDVLLAAGNWLENRGFTNPAYIPWRTRVAPALAALGRHEEAREVIEPAVRRAKAFGAPWALGMSLRASGTVEQGERGLALLREAITVLERSSCELERAHALLELGAALRRTNQRAKAREHLREALDVAHRCGAAPLAERARQELAATGARPRRVMLTGAEALTASERRVAELAASGRSNAEVAQQLFVTRKTIESHLGHVYQKLDINSREQLIEALQQPTPADSR